MRSIVLQRLVLLAAILAAARLQPLTAATFTGSAEARFVVTEYLDNSSVTVAQVAPISFTFTTDYKQISWGISYDVDLLMAGGADQPYETRFKAKGSLATVAPSSLTFPGVGGGTDSEAKINGGILSALRRSCDGRHVRSSRNRHSG